MCVWLLRHKDCVARGEAVLLVSVSHSRFILTVCVGWVCFGSPCVCAPDCLPAFKEFLIGQLARLALERVSKCSRQPVKCCAVVAGHSCSHVIESDCTTMQQPVGRLHNHVATSRQVAQSCSNQ